MNQEELTELAKDGLTCKSYWEIFDSSQDWFIDKVIIPYICTKLSNEDQLYRLQQALNIAEVKNDS